MLWWLLAIHRVQFRNARLTYLPTLFIGNKNYSSWSMRPWLALRWANIDFVESLMPLGPRGAGPNPDFLAVSPSGTVPALKFVESELIGDSLAICEWAHEAAPNARLWPTNPVARALARSASAEMHSGFGPLRQEMPMNIKRRKTNHTLSDAAKANVARVDGLLSSLIERFDGTKSGWLFGHRTIADAFYAPVATRFRTYDVPLSPLTQKWCNTLFADTDFQAWERAAEAEIWTIDETDSV
jgi:glutathione S-transferase